MDEKDRSELRRRIGINLALLHGRCLAWAFMPNHFHLLFHSIDGNLPVFMRCVMSGYAMYFNRKHNRVGHLFQNRYKSSVVESDAYLVELIRYIHLNPVRSGLVPSVAQLADYRWTGHYAIVRTADLPWKDIPHVQSCFVNGPGEDEVSRYVEFLEDGLKKGLMVQFPDGRGRGEEEDGASCPSRAASSLGPSRENSFDKAARAICMEYGIPFTRLRDDRRSRDLTRARRKILSVCVFRLGMSMRSVSSMLGITRAGASFLMRGIDPDGGTERQDDL